MTPTTTLSDDPRTTRKGAPERHRVLVVDPDPLARRALVDGLRLDGSFLIIGQAVDGVEGVELALHYRPDLVLLAAALPGLDVIDACARINARAPECRVVMLSTGLDLDLEMRAIRAGACGFLSKEADTAALSHALDAIASGEHVISRELTTHLVDRLRRTPEAGVGTRPVKSSLTGREWEVLDHVCGGATTREVAERLFLSNETVNSHIKSIMRKLGVHSRADAVAVAGKLRSGMLA
jgi:two-component system, NarL family, response regulator LiaR